MCFFSAKYGEGGYFPISNQFNFLAVYLHVTHVLLLLSFINFPFEMLVQSLVSAKSWRMYSYRGFFFNSSFFLWINYEQNHLLSACLCSKQMIAGCVFDCISYYFMYFNFWSNHSLTSAVHSSASQRLHAQRREITEKTCTTAECATWLSI